MYDLAIYVSVVSIVCIVCYNIITEVFELNSKWRIFWNHKHTNLIFYLSHFSFSLTLVDSLDTLVVLGDIEEFDRALRLVVRDVGFDHDLVVSVFETNIRMVGGLLSGHIMAEHLNQVSYVLWYYAVKWIRLFFLFIFKRNEKDYGSCR